MNFIFSLRCLIILSLYSFGAWARYHDVQLDVNEIEVKADSGKQYKLKLSPLEESILDSNIKVISIDKSHENGKLSLNSWTPSNEELQEVQKNVFVDKDSLATVRIGKENGERALNGIIDGMRIETRDGVTRLVETPSQNHSDYIDIGRTITPSKMRQSGSLPVVVELLLVCDKEFSDIFQQDRRRILEYLTVYFWDINLRYRTLPSSNISFRITGVVIINTLEGQPFIEQARASDGRAEFGRILEKFSHWVYGKSSSVPKYDVAVAITNTKLEWHGGLAYYRAACFTDNSGERYWGSTVFNDNGGWGSVTVGAHEIGHVLGAPHDDDSSYPGGCSDRGYIMSGGNEDLKWFFSTCSDRTIGDFVNSNEATCLKRQDENGSPAVSPDYSAPLAPTMEEQCQRRLNEPSAFVPEGDKGNCKVMKCWVRQSDGGYLIWSLDPVDNTPCTNGRCFRGRCRKTGSLFANVGSGQCIRASNSFKSMVWLEMVPCPSPVRSGTPLERFVINETSSIGKLLSTPYQTPDAKENSDMCIYTGYNDDDTLWTDKCNPNNPWQGWDLNDVGNGEIMLYHRVSKGCAKQVGNTIRSYKSCDRNDRSFRWKLL